MLSNPLEKKNIVLVDIERWLPTSDELIFLDLKPFLYQGLILKEKDFRNQIEEINWADYAHKHVVIFCSNHAIIPQWAFMLIAEKLATHQAIGWSNSEDIRERILLFNIQHIDIEPYRNQRVLIKGCGKEKLSIQPWIMLTQRLKPIAKACAYGEACSQVPIFK